MINSGITVVISFVLSWILGATARAGFQWPIVQQQADAANVSQSNKGVTPLEEGKPIEREVRGDLVHSYLITLTYGQYLSLVVDQRGIDVVATVFAPDGSKLIEMDSPNGAQGPEPISLIAEMSGSFRLEVRSLDKSAPPGRYEVRVEEVRMATELDKTRVAADLAFAEGEQLRSEGGAESLRKAIEKYGQALLTWRALGYRKNEARTLIRIGETYADLGQVRTAVDHYKEALPIWRTVEDPAGEAVTLNNLGVAYDKLGDSQSALGFHNQALVMRRAAGNQSAEAQTLNNIGAVYDELGERRTSLDYYKRALPLWREVGDRKGEAFTLTNMGVAYLYLGEMQSSLDHLNDALSIRRALNDRRDQAYTLHNLGVAFHDLGEADKSLNYFLEALSLMKDSGDARGEAYTLTDIGIIYRDLNQPDKSLEYFNQALDLRRKVSDRRGEAYTLNHMGKLYMGLRDYNRALELYHQALGLKLDVIDRAIEAETLNNMGMVYASIDDHQRALTYFDKVLHLSRAINDLQMEAATLGNIARSKAGLNDLTGARSQIEGALNIIETLRTQVASPSLRSTYFSTVQDYYGLYIDLLMQLHRLGSKGGYDALAFEASERARARSLLELLAEARAGIRQGAQPELLERERSLYQLLKGKAERLVRLFSGEYTEQQVATLKKEIDALTTKYDQIQARIKLYSPAYARLTQPQPWTTREIQAHVLDDDTMLLEYSLGQDRSYLWVMSRASIKCFELPKRQEVEEAARRVYTLLAARVQCIEGETEEQRRLRIVQADASYWQEAARLSQMIFAPASPLLANKRLVIILDGALQYLPFAALPVPNSTQITDGQSLNKTASRADYWTPLIVEHEIVTLPSASVLGVMRRETAGRKPAAKTVAVLADPVFAEDDERIGLKEKKPVAKVDAKSSRRVIITGTRAQGAIGAPTKPHLEPPTQLIESEFERAVRDMSKGCNRGKIPRLPFSRREAEAILSLAPQSEAMKAVDFTASRGTAMGSELSRYRIIHFATHGLLNDEHPELSGILLSMVDENGQPQNGFLQLHEIYNLNLPAELVVLSACQTGLGKEIRGEGLIGLTRGFMYAGARRVMASLWSVNDLATSELMKRFYSGLLGEKQMRMAEALRAAQIEMWKQKRWQPPYYWAGFVLQGDWK